MKIDTRLHVAIKAPRFLPGGHIVVADNTMCVFEATGFIGNTYYWTIADAKTLLQTLKQLVSTTTITQPAPEFLSEQEVHGFIHDLEGALREKMEN